MVHEHACQLLSHGLGQQGGAHGAVHAARQRQQHPSAAHLFPNGGDCGPLVILHGPVALGPADLIEEVPDHFHAVFSVIDLRVVLHPVEAPLHIGDGHVGAGFRMGRQREPVRDLLHVVPVAHPADARLRQPLEEGAGGVIERLRLPVLPGGVVLGGGYLSAQGMGHQLAAVADAQPGEAHFKDSRVHAGGGFQVNGIGAAGKNEPDGVHFFQLRQGGGIGLYFAVDAAFSYPSGD